MPQGHEAPRFCRHPSVSAKFHLELSVTQHQTNGIGRPRDYWCGIEDRLTAGTDSHDVVSVMSFGPSGKTDPRPPSAGGVWRTDCCVRMRARFRRRRREPAPSRRPLAGTPCTRPPNRGSDERIPWIVIESPTSSRQSPIRPSILLNADTDIGLFSIRPGKTHPFGPCMSFRISSARPTRGTRCSRAAFIRPGGICQMAASRSISRQCAPAASLHLTPVDMQNSSALALRLGCRRKAAMKEGTSAYGSAG